MGHGTVIFRAVRAAVNEDIIVGFFVTGCFNGARKGNLFFGDFLQGQWNKGQGVIFHGVRSIKDLDTRPVSAFLKIDAACSKGPKLICALACHDGRVDIVIFYITFDIEPIVIGQPKGMGIILPNHKIRDRMLGGKVDEHLVKCVIIPIECHIFPFEIHRDFFLDAFIKGFIIGQAADLFIHIDGPGHKMPLVPSVGKDLITDEQAGNDREKGNIPFEDSSP